MRYEIKRGNEIIFNHEINGKRTKTAPAVDFVDIDFTYYKSILFKKNDTLVFKGQTYYCDARYNTNVKQSENLFKHTAKFVSENYRATEIVLLDPNNKPKFDIEGNLNTLLSLAVLNLNRVSSGWSFSVLNNNTSIEKFQIDGDNVMAFLVKVSGTYEMPFSINNKVISFIPILNNTATNIAYGKGNGLLDIKKSYNNSVLIPNTVYGIGGDGIELDAPIKNQSHIDANGVIEGIYTNSSIVPTTQSIVSEVPFNNVITTITPYFDLNQYLINRQKAVINFENGPLGGLSFYIDYFDYNTTNNVSTIYIVKRIVDGVELPNDAVKPEVGVNFNITDIKQPTEVVAQAKAKLKDEATKFLNNGINKALKLDVNIDPLFDNNIMLNSRLHIVDKELDIDNTFFVNEIREDLQNLNKKEVVLQITHRNVFKPKLDRIYSDLINMAISDINDVKLPLLTTDVVRAYERGDLAYLKAENIEDVKLPPIANNASSALTQSNTNAGSITAINTELPKKATIASVTAVDTKATNAQNLAGTANTNASNALSGLEGKADIYNGELFSPVIETTDDPIIGDARVELNMRDDSSIDINPISGAHSTSGSVSFKPIIHNGDLRIAFMINNIFNTEDSEELPMNTIYSDNNGFIKIKQ